MKSIATIAPHNAKQMIPIATDNTAAVVSMILSARLSYIVSPRCEHWRSVREAVTSPAECQSKEANKILPLGAIVTVFRLMLNSSER